MKRWGLWFWTGWAIRVAAMLTFAAAAWGFLAALQSAETTTFVRVLNAISFGINGWIVTYTWRNTRAVWK